MSSASIFKRLFTKLLILSSLYGAPCEEKGLPNLSTRQNPSTSQWTFSADFLAWLASEEVSSIWADVITIGDNTSSWDAKGFNFDWDYGFRAGANYGFTYDNWDAAAYWTWFRTEKVHEIPFAPNASISPEFFAAFLSGTPPESMSVKWGLLFDLFDLELGRSYWVSPSLALRPFIGIKGGWIHQSIHARYQTLLVSSVPTKESAKEELANNFWGAGPLGGVNTTWQMRQLGSHNLNLFGDFSFATLWGSWHCSDVYTDSNSKSSSVNMSDSTLGALMLRGFLGFEWGVDFCKSRFAAKLGYEMQIWLNQLRIATFQLQRLHGDLTLQGATLNGRLDF